MIQALISRGDRRLGKLLQLTREFGDSVGSYKRAFKQLKGEIPPLNYYVHDRWSADKILPWQHLRGALPVKTLVKHLNEAINLDEGCGAELKTEKSAIDSFK